MNSLQKSYNAFIESTCAELGCSELAHPLQEGFSTLFEAEDDDDDGMRQCKVCHEWKYPEDLDENGVCKAYQEDDDVYDYCQRLYDSVGGNVKLIRRAKCQSCGMPIIGDQTMPKSYLTSYVCDRCQSKRKAAPARTRCCNCGVQLNDPSLYTKDGRCPACDEMFGEFGKAAFGNREPEKSECEQCHRDFYLCDLDDNGLCRDCAGDDWDDKYTGRDPGMTPKDHCSVCHRPLYSVGSADTYGRCRECEKKNLKPGSR